MHFSRDFGYGLMDVSAAVRLAESWTLPAGTVANWQSAEGVSATASAAIPDISPAGLTVTASVASNVRIERMEFDLNLTAANPSQLSATITSPNGTTVTLFDQPLTRNLVDGVPDMSTPEPSWPSTFTIGSTAFLGEPSSGTWTLKLTDKVAGEVATYNSLTVRAWGSAITADSQYVLTDEFSVANATLTDASGTDTLNAAAVSGTVRLDLIAGDKSTVGAGQLTIAPGSVIENAIGGLGNDTLIGNTANNVLRGNAGNDTIDGSAGIDTAVFGSGRTNYTLTKTGTGFTALAMSGTDGTDTITDVERLQFSDAKLALDLDGNAGKTAKLLGVVFSPASVSNKQFVGIGLSLLDGGMTYPDLMAAALRAAGATSNSAVVNLLWNNLFGSAPTSEQAKPFVDLLDNGTIGAGSLGVAAAELQPNQSNINLVGLQQTGIEYV